MLGPQAERFLGPPRRGRLFWDRWLREYYSDRVPVTVAVHRIVSWPDPRCDGEPSVEGAPLPETHLEAQAEPSKGTRPRVDTERAAHRLSALAHRLLAFAGADGFPTVLPFELEGVGSGGLAVRVAGGLPSGGRRAGLLAHEYRPQLIGLAARQHTGWLAATGADGRAAYEPHTEAGFRAPPNKTLLLLANGLLAKRGLRRARAAAGAS